MDERERRMAQNEALFREVNERVREVATTLGDDGRYEYFCECANKDCTFHVPLTTSEYEAIRSDSQQFFVLPGHVTPEVEEIVLETASRSEEHTSELQSRRDLVCRLLLEKKKSS